MVFAPKVLACVAAALAITAVVFHANAEDSETSATTTTQTGINPFEGKPDAIEKGKSIYSNTCLFCHGANGMGARAPNLVKGMFRPNGGADDEIIFGVILGGRPGTIMGSFEGTLTTDEIWEVMAYLRAEARTQALQKGKKKRIPNP